MKGSIFDILGEMIRDKTVLDLFAGTGNLGIEALSRGARKSFFVEKEREPLRLLQTNLRRCQMDEKSEILPKDVTTAIRMLFRRNEVFDVIFMDPPYRKGWIEKTIVTLDSQPIYHEQSVLMVQHDRRESLPERIQKRWSLIRQRRMGDTMISFLVPLP